MKYILLVLLTFKCQKLTESQVPRDPLTDWIKNVVTTVVGGDPGSKGLSEIVMSEFSSYCSARLSDEYVTPPETPNVMGMNYILLSGFGENRTVPLNEPHRLWTLKEFNRKLPTVIMITGWASDNSIDSHRDLNNVWRAYKCRGNINFVHVDTDGFLTTLYTWAAFNTQEIGNIISNSLIDLIQSYPIENIHLIGHSLGAHIAGAAGRFLTYKTGKVLPRITGLDPANPCFNWGDKLMSLTRGDAEFVMVIHTNPGGFGKREPLGDADFYPNGLNTLPPGCMELDCAHRRATELYGESVFPGYENNFIGVKCTSIEALNSQSCPGIGYPMGFATPSTVKGNLFLTTKSQSPYGLNAPPNYQPICNRWIDFDNEDTSNFLINPNNIKIEPRI